jgi:tRNA(Ile)-lysidine synthase
VPVRRGSDLTLGQGGADAPLLFALRAAVAGPARLGIAVSGGSDSLALLHLCAELAEAMGWDLHAATVDHALRPESAAEAARVGEICAGLGVPHQILRWEHGAIAGNLQDQARRARYGLMAEWAQAEGISHVMIGHTADDQAETFLMGLSRAAGLDGLTGMRRDWDEGGVRFWRPLLGLKRSELRDYLTRHGVAWIEDPSNDNDRFARVKARRALKALKPLGITVGRLNETILHLAEAQDGLRAAASQTWDSLGKEQAGALHIGRREFTRLGWEMQRRILLAAIQWLVNDEHAPRGRKVATLQASVIEGRETTLNGCRFRFKDQTLSIYREPRAVKDLENATTELWDKRWQITGPHAEGLTIRALGVEGLAACAGWRDLKIPRDALLVSPAVWQGATLIAAPLAGKPNGWQAILGRSLNHVLLSH